MYTFNYNGISLRRNIPNSIIPNKDINYSDRVYTFKEDPFIYVNPINVGGLTPIYPIPNEPVLKAGESEILTLSGRISLGCVANNPPMLGTEIDIFLVEYFNQDTESLNFPALTATDKIYQEEVLGSRVSFYKNTNNSQFFNFNIKIPNTRRNPDQFKTRYFKLAIQLNSRSTLDKVYLSDVATINITDNNMDNAVLTSSHTIQSALSFDFDIIKTPIYTKAIPYSTLRGA